jgi:rhodanese-related sulfurtransferase
MKEFKTITVERLVELEGQGPVDVIDVRTPVEYREVRAVNARNVPLDSLDPHAVMKQRNGAAGDPLYVMCRSGTRGAKACQKFVDAGYANVVNIDGGVGAWEEAEHPVVRGKKMVSLERQVRMAAGFLVLLGAVLSFFSPYWIGLSGFVGAGLIFAGITDTCGMGMLIAKMPWNQIEDKTQCCSVN